MPGTTPRFALPYPLGTDPVSDGDDTIKALAEKIDTLTWPTWTAFPFAGGWTNLGGVNPAEYCKAGGWLHMRGMALFTSGGTTTVGTLPAGYRPAASVIASVAEWNGSGLVASQLTINPAGVLTISLTPASNHNFPLLIPSVWVGP